MTRVSGCLYSLYLSIQSSHTLDRAGASCHLDILYFYLAHGSYCDHVLLVSLFLHLCILWHIASHTNSWYFLPKPHDMAGDVPPSAWFLPAEGGAGLGVSIQASSHAQPSLGHLWSVCGPPGHRPYINDLVQADIALKILISLPSLVFVSSWFPHTIACQPLTQLHLISLQVCHTIWHSYQWLNFIKYSSVCNLRIDTFDHWLRKWFIRFPWACYVIY